MFFLVCESLFKLASNCTGRSSLSIVRQNALAKCTKTNICANKVTRMYPKENTVMGGLCTHFFFQQTARFRFRNDTFYRMCRVLIWHDVPRKKKKSQVCSIKCTQWAPKSICQATKWEKCIYFWSRIMSCIVLSCKENTIDTKYLLCVQHLLCEGWSYKKVVYEVNHFLNNALSGHKFHLNLETHFCFIIDT